MSKEKDKNKAASPSSYGTFQGVPTYPPPLYHHPPSHRPVTGFPQRSPPPGAAHQDISVHQYIQEHHTGPGHPVYEEERTVFPVLALALFIIGFLLGSIPWYIGVLVCSKINPREKLGYVACTIAAAVATIAIIFGLTEERRAWS